MGVSVIKSVKKISHFQMVVNKVYILLCNSCVKFHSKICMYC